MRIHSHFHETRTAFPNKSCLRQDRSDALIKPEGPSDTNKNHPATLRGGRKLNGQSKVLPCVFTGSVVSGTPQRLWPGAQWTVAVQGKRGTNVKLTVSDVQRKGTNRTTKEGKASGRSDRHCHLPSASGEARGACEIQEKPVDELEEYLYP